MAKKRKSVGRCLLTGKTGVFVQSHILPKALTRPEIAGEPFEQILGQRVVRRFSSWYDTSIVIRDGESVLADYDSWAISFLRAKQLIWSGWGPMQVLSDVKLLPGTNSGIRKVSFLKIDDAYRLRLWTLTLLWRASVTNLPEFSSIKLDIIHIEKLRVMIINGNALPLYFYPVQLIQFSTIGMVHNQAGFSDRKLIPDFGQGEEEVPFFRFYVDGLIIHIHKTEGRVHGALDLGGGTELVVTTVTFEASTQAKRLVAEIAEASKLIAAK
jgi:hypothetical protein